MNQTALRDLRKMANRQKLLEVSSMQQWNGSFTLDAKFGQCFGVNASTLDQSKHVFCSIRSAFALKYLMNCDYVINVLQHLFCVVL